MSKAIGYVRVPPETFSDADSIERQQSRIARWAGKAGMPLRNVHVESNDTAPDGIGEGLQAALAELKAGDVLVIDRLALAAPNLPDWMTVVERIQHAGADLAAAGDDFDTRPESPGGPQVARLIKALSRLPRELVQPMEASCFVAEKQPSIAKSSKNSYLSVYTQARGFLAANKKKRAISLWREYLNTATGENAACGWNCLGDIFVNRNKIGEAVQHFLQAAEAFEAAGYPDRSLAMYNKAQRHAPLQTEVILRKARLFTQLGRMGDAVGCYLDYARAQAESGDISNALRVFDRIRVLDPVNVRFRLQLAAELQEFGFTSEAVAEELYAAELMVQNGRPDQARQQLVRVMESHPENTEVASFIDRIDRGEYAAPPIDDEPDGPLLQDMPNDAQKHGAEDGEDFLKMVNLHEEPEQVWVRG